MALKVKNLCYRSHHCDPERLDPPQRKRGEEVFYRKSSPARTLSFKIKFISHPNDFIETKKRPSDGRIWGCHSMC